jgi:hypothetical protein
MAFPSALRVAPELVRELPLEDAVAIEVDSPPDLMPRQAVEEAVAAHSSEYSDRLRGAVRRGIVTEPSEIVAARKARGGHRPVPVLTLHERVLLRALSIRFENEVDDDIVAPRPYRSMVSGPIDAQSPWVVHADVAAFYTYVDHDLLEGELVAQTGDAAAAELVVELLSALVGRRFGLPQGHRASDVFANVYVDVAERAMARRGRVLWRYADDFRIEAASHVDAMRCIEELDEELRRIGLVLNDDKTFPQSSSDYQAWVTEGDEQVQRIAADLQVDLFDWNPYDDSVTPMDGSDVFGNAAVQVLYDWYEHRRHITHGPAALASRKALATAIEILMSLRWIEGVQFCTDIVRSEPQMTDQLARYLRVAMEVDTDRATEEMRRLIDIDQFLNSWQQLWILDALRGAERLDAPLEAWARTRMLDVHGTAAVRTGAAVLLSDNFLVDIADLVELLISLPAASRLEITAALGRREWSATKAETRAVRSDFLSQMVFDHFASVA